MKCPKCNDVLFFDDTFNEDTSQEDIVIWDWFTLCPNCHSKYKVREIYTLTHQEIIEED